MSTPPAPVGSRLPPWSPGLVWLLPFCAGLALRIPGVSWQLLLDVADPVLRFGPFAGSFAAVDFTRPPPRIEPEEVPSVYRVLAAEGAAGAVLEAPSGRISRDTLAEQVLARVHGQRVIVAAVESDLPHPRFADPRLALRTLSPLEPVAFLESRARFLVVHLDRGRFNALARSSSGHPRRPSGFDRVLAEEGRHLARRLEQTWGEPHLSGGSVRVWDLALVRARWKEG
ncbi:MAG: hypothetical protein ACLF0P_12715 [Thermoanaerobaculia bacterium]